jgi:hypothetical protein
LDLAFTSYAQISNGALTGGTKNALDGAKIEFRSSIALTSSAASVSLGGTSATITGFDNLGANSGSLSLEGGANFSTSGSFTNIGAVSVGAGSKLVVKGAYTQGPSASLTIGLASGSSGSTFGQLAVTGSAALAGSVLASTTIGFMPAASDNFPIVSYSSETGGDSITFTGFSSGVFSGFQPVVGVTSITVSAAAGGSANLVVQPFNVDASKAVAQNITVSYQVKDESTSAASGAWTDSIYLSPQPALSASSVLLGRVQHTGGVAANGQYSGTLSATVPGLLSNNYYVIVLADSRGVFPEFNRTGTVPASTNPVQITVPSLSIGNPVAGTITSGQSLL